MFSNIAMLSDLPTQIAELSRSGVQLDFLSILSTMISCSSLEISDSLVSIC